jgi:hypothetical protein
MLKKLLLYAMCLARFVVFIILMVPFNAIAQKASYQQRTETPWKQIATYWAKALTCRAIQNGDNSFIEFEIGRNHNMFVNADDTVYLNFADQTQMKLTCFRKEVTHRFGFEYVLPESYQLSMDNIEKLKMLHLQSIRLPIGNGEYVVFDIKPRNKNAIAKSLAALSN